MVRPIGFPEVLFSRGPLFSHGGTHEPERPQWEPLPVWEDPFKTIKIAEVAWPGDKRDDRGLYKLDNGRSAFADKGLSVGQAPFDYEEIRLQGGGYYDAPSGVVGLIHKSNPHGIAFIIKQGDSYQKQQVVWAPPTP